MHIGMATPQIIKSNSETRVTKYQCTVLTSLLKPSEHIEHKSVHLCISKP